MLGHRALVALVVGFASLAGLSGCGGGKSGLATVTGVVKHNDAPVEGAKVTFHSTIEVDGKTLTYSAHTDSSGKYLIAAVGKEPGIPAGMYKVSVTKFIGKGMEGMDAGQMDAMASDSAPGAKGGPANALPMLYASPASSKLSATLETGRNKDVNFDLKGK